MFCACARVCVCVCFFSGFGLIQFFLFFPPKREFSFFVKIGVNNNVNIDNNNNHTHNNIKNTMLVLHVNLEQHNDTKIE